MVKHLVELYLHEKTNSHKNQELKKFISYQKKIVVKNRTHVLFSRNLTTLEAWELMTFLGESIINSEDGEEWQKIIYRDNQEGYISLKQKANFIEIKNQKLISLYHNFYQKNYITNVENSIQFYYQTKNKIEKELAILLAYKNLNEIAKRATSIKNPYTDFVLQFPNYFFSTNSEKLEVQNSFFLLLYQFNQKSFLLPFFNSYP